MDRERFRDWFSRVDEFTAAQRSEVAAVLSDPPESAAALAAIELGVDDELRCPHRSAGGAVSRGKAHGLRRFRCKECGRTFGALTGTALSGLHHMERKLAFGASLGEGETIKEPAARCEMAPNTAHRWRHRFLAAVKRAPDRLAGIVEADETFVLESRKGQRKLDCKPRRQGEETRPLARAGAGPGRRRPRSRCDPHQPHPACAERRQRAGDAGADPRPECPAGLRRRPLLSARLGGARHPSRERQRLYRRSGPRRSTHPDGQRPPQPDQGLPAQAARHRHQVPRQLSEVVPSHRTRRSTIAESMSPGGDDQVMPTCCE